MCRSPWSGRREAAVDASTAAGTPGAGAQTGRFGWRPDPDPRWDEDRRRVFGTVPAGVFDGLPQVEGARLTADWWAVTDGGRVVGYGWLDDVWGDAEILLAVEEPARGTGAGTFALARLEAEAAARGLGYVVNVVRETHPDRAEVTAWFLSRGFRGTDDGRLRKQVVAPAAAPSPGAGDPSRQARYAAERERAAARPREPVEAPDAEPMGPGHEEQGGYVDVDQHRF
jgi:N-acetylglutamate synthase-like GNAT family acetyltransferase